MPSARNINAVLLAGIALCLLQVWLPGHYLTCDGPCHLYNARIVHDLWAGQHTAFYSKYYDHVFNADPNTTTTYILALLLYVAKGAIAEKVFLSIYIITLVCGARRLMSTLAGSRSWWELCVLIFVFTRVLSQGFYNFSLGAALYPWMVWAWLQWLRAESKISFSALAFFAVAGATYFTHLLPFLTGALTCGLLSVSHAAAGDPAMAPRGRQAVTNLGILTLLLAPFALLAMRFTNGEGGLQLELGAHPYRIVELLEFKHLINVVGEERIWAAICGIAFIIVFALAIWYSRRTIVHRYDGILWTLLPITFVYLFFPEDFMGRAIVISPRVQPLIFLLTACVAAYRRPPRSVALAGTAIILLAYAGMSVLRIQCRQKADAALEPYLAMGAHIKPLSVVLALDLAPGGSDASGKQIAGRNAIFHHAAHYIAADKPLIMLDNYEANTGYFPITWKAAMNPYAHLSRGAGIEGMPPDADIGHYERTTGTRIDHVVISGARTAEAKHPGFAALYEEIVHRYRKTHTPESGQAILFSRN